MTLETICGIILGIAFGIAASFVSIMFEIKRSNDLGDTKAAFSDFSEDDKPQMIAVNDNVPRDIYLDAILLARKTYHEAHKENHR